MINYLVEIFIYQAIFISLYQLLKTEPLFKVNRFYLLISLAISLILPLINFSYLYSIEVNNEYVQWLQPIQIGTGQLSNATNDFATSSSSTGFQWNFYLLFYTLGLITYSIWFSFKNRNLFHHLRRSSQSFYRDKKLVILPNTSTAFSFWNRIYIGENITEPQREIILEHEYQHLKQKHSWDLLALEVLQFALWFNPLIVLYKKHLRQIHEFEADRFATQNTTKSSYVNTLLNQNFGSQNISFVNSFYQSSNLKKRINMLHKSKFNRLKYLLIFPILSLAILISCTQDSGVEQEMTLEEQQADRKAFHDKLFKSEPDFFDKVEKKPDVKTLLNSYHIEVKEEYSEHEEEKVGLVLGLLKLSNVYKNDQDYQDRIDKEINKTKGLQSIVAILEEKMKGNSITQQTEVQELDPNSDIPFALIDQVPHPATCNGKTGEALKQCVSEFISTHVNQNFDTGLGKELGLSGRNRVSVQFKIDKNGNIIDVRARAPHPELEKEAQRVIKTLPQMIPGQVDGEKVNVLYGLPINFVIQE
jgi:beta-lactamase regulating signal transducer with metallopeptidase domain